jgi:uncharacterized protein YggE
MRRFGNIRHFLFLSAAALLFHLPPPTAASENEAPPALTVQGHGEIDVPPDLAMVQLGALVQAPEADRAQRQVSQIMQRALKAFEELGVDAQAVRTTGLSLAPVYSKPDRDKPEDQEVPQVVGYRAANTLQIRVENLSRVGEVIDAGIASGANRLLGISFDVRDDERHRLQALQLAARDAMAKAAAIAEAMALRLGDVMEVRESGARLLRPAADHRVYAAAAEATPVQPGRLQIAADVEVRYRLVQP